MILIFLSYLNILAVQNLLGFKLKQMFQHLSCLGSDQNLLTKTRHNCRGLWPKLKAWWTRNGLRTGRPCKYRPRQTCFFFFFFQKICWTQFSWMFQNCLYFSWSSCAWSLSFVSMVIIYMIWNQDLEDYRFRKIPALDGLLSCQSLVNHIMVIHCKPVYINCQDSKWCVSRTEFFPSCWIQFSVWEYGNSMSKNRLAGLHWEELVEWSRSMIFHVGRWETATWWKSWSMVFGETLHILLCDVPCL